MEVIIVANKSIRAYAKKHGVCLWEIAAALSISEPTMTRKLRFELSSTEKAQIKGIIDSISAKKGIVSNEIPT